MVVKSLAGALCASLVLSALPSQSWAALARVPRAIGAAARQPTASGRSWLPLPARPVNSVLVSPLSLQAVPAAESSPLDAAVPAAEAAPLLAAAVPAVESTPLQAAVSPDTDAPSESLRTSAALRFDGPAASADATPPPVEPGAAPSPSVPEAAPSAETRPRRREIRDRFTSRLARFSGAAAVWSIYRDGVLLQRQAERLHDGHSSPARRASAARALGRIGRPESLPRLA